MFLPRGRLSHSAAAAYVNETNILRAIARETCGITSANDPVVVRLIEKEIINRWGQTYGHEAGVSIIEL